MQPSPVLALSRAQRLALDAGVSTGAQDATLLRAEERLAALYVLHRMRQGDRAATLTHAAANALVEARADALRSLGLEAASPSRAVRHTPRHRRPAAEKAARASARLPRSCCPVPVQQRCAPLPAARRALVACVQVALRRSARLAG